jgi:hypothetical protein
MSIVTSLNNLDQQTLPEDYNTNSSTNATSQNRLEYFNSKLYRSAELINTVAGTTKISLFVAPDKTSFSAPVWSAYLAKNTPVLHSMLAAECVLQTFPKPALGIA